METFGDLGFKSCGDVSQGTPEGSIKYQNKLKQAVSRGQNNIRDMSFDLD